MYPDINDAQVRLQCLDIAARVLVHGGDVIAEAERIHAFVVAGQTPRECPIDPV
jgi:hypothetical protein